MNVSARDICRISDGEYVVYNDDIKTFFVGWVMESGRAYPEMNGRRYEGPPQRYV